MLYLHYLYIFNIAQH